MDLSIDWSNFRHPLFSLMPLCVMFLIVWIRGRYTAMRVIGLLILIDLAVIGLIVAILFLNFIVQLFLKV